MSRTYEDITFTRHFTVFPGDTYVLADRWPKFIRVTDELVAQADPAFMGVEGRWLYFFTEVEAANYKRTWFGHQRGVASFRRVSVNRNAARHAIPGAVGFAAHNTDSEQEATTT